MGGDEIDIGNAFFAKGKQNSPEHPCERCGSTSTCDCPIETQWITSRERTCVVCGSSYLGGHVYTCSEICHEKFVSKLIAEFGEFKKVVDVMTRKAYRVPTRDIVEKGLRHRDLTKYPKWKEP
jgi:hypothetical protein